MEQPRLPSEYKPYIQPISGNLVLYKLEKILGRAPAEEDRRLLAPCRCVEDFMSLITETYIGDVFIKGSGAGLGRMGEFYVSLRCEKAVEWEPQPGYDLWGAWRYEDLVKAGKVEVKTCGVLPDSRKGWTPRISGRLDTMVADVVVFICLVSSLNPCAGKVFVVPRVALQETFDEQREKSRDRPKIHISRNRINSQTKQQNPWYEYLVMDHTAIKVRIGEYIHGHYRIVTPEQLTLF